MIQELMIPVEQAVRPIKAGHQRKMQMREELYALIHDRYESFLAQGKPDDRARELAIIAFGDPDQIGQELQSTVPRFARWSARIDAFLIPEDRLPSLRHAGCAGLLLTLPLGIWLVAMWMLMAAIDPARFPFGILVEFLLLSSLFGIGTAAMVWSGPRGIQCLQQQRWPAACLHALAAAAVLAVCHALLFVTTDGVFYFQTGWKLTLFGVAASVPLYLLVCRQVVSERRQRAEWKELDLSGTATA